MSRVQQALRTNQLKHATPHSTCETRPSLGCAYFHLIRRKGKIDVTKTIMPFEDQVDFTMERRWMETEMMRGCVKGMFEGERVEKASLR